MNTAALHRLAIYTGIVAAHLLRALPELKLDHDPTHSVEPVLRVGPAKRTFLRNCPACQRRTGGAVLAPDRRGLQLICPHHKTWLVKADPPLGTHLVPEVRSAAKVLDRQQQRHTTDVIHTLYADVRGHLTFQWRGLGWHTQLTKRWIIRQQILRPDADHKDLYALARTEHWSMLPETTAIISVLADSRQPAAVQRIHSQRILTESLNHSLHLDNHWPIDINPLRPGP